MLQSVKLADYPGLAEFLAESKAATIAVPIDSHGTIHAASLLYWNSPNPLKFYFVTSRDSEKYRLLKTQPSINCAAVVGTEKNTPFTLQLRGKLQEADPSEHQNIIDSYYQKRGNRHDDIAAPNICLLEFIPAWGRFTDYSKDYARYQLGIS